MDRAQGKLREQLAQVAWGVLAPDARTYDARALLERLQPILLSSARAAISALLEDVQAPRPLCLEALEGLDDRLPTDLRRQHGIYHTPDWLADLLASLLRSPEGLVVDLSAGAGALLLAALEGSAARHVLGVEQRPLLALACALRIWAFRVARSDPRDDPGSVAWAATLRDRIGVGDGLSGSWMERLGESAAMAVIGNPPYVGEKGNRALFEAIREANPALGPYMGPRVDLSYLFFHRGLDWLGAGGQLVMLSSEYWLYATGANTLRDDLLRRAIPELFLSAPGRALFPQAPGHHSLISAFRRRRSDQQEEGSRPQRESYCSARLSSMHELTSLRDLPQAKQGGAGLCGGEPWHPFVEPSQQQWLLERQQTGDPLGELALDRQGVVSGADRLTRRHQRKFASVEGLCVGEPIFLFAGEQGEGSVLEQQGLLRPLLRGRQLVANRVYVGPCVEDRMLYVDGLLEGVERSSVEEHLSRFGEILRARREVKSGAIPWYRLHWPRRREEMEGPKLVVPRRAPRACFALDLSGSIISSDCSYLVAPAWVEQPVRHLLALMLALNGAATARYLQWFGKRKGKQLEFYAQPLAAIPLSLRRREAGLVLEEQQREEIEEALEQIERMKEGWVDVEASVVWDW